MGKFEIMKEKIAELNGNCGRQAAMDIGAMECPPCNQPIAPTGQAPELGEVEQKRHKPNMRCWTCNQLGHPSWDCPTTKNAGAATGGGPPPREEAKVLLEDLHQEKHGSQNEVAKVKKRKATGKGFKGKGGAEAQDDWWDS